MKTILRFCLVLLALNINMANAQVALALNGSSNYVSTSGTPVTGNQARTVDAWIKTTSSLTTQMVICDWGVITPNASRFTLNVINSKLRIEVGGVGFAGTTNLNTGQWFHVSAVYSPSITSGANAFLYVNGVLEASGTFTGYPVLSTTTTVGFRIGVRVDGINYFNGAVDEVKVYNYARTQAQIAADTLEYCGPQSGLVAYYKLNEGIPNAVNSSSTTAIDYSGNGNNGTLNSFSLTGTTSNWVPGRISSGASSITSSAGNNICTGATLTLTTNAANNFTWSTGNTSSTLIAVSPTTTGNYSITTTNTLNNCTLTSIITITVNSTAPTVTVLAAQNPICTGASTSFSATGAVSYSWTGGINNNQNFTPSVTTSYTLVAANACGTVSSVQTITVAPLPVSVLASPATVCQGYTAAISATAAANGYTWFPGGITGSAVVVSPNANTIYTVTASNGTCVGTQTLQLSTLATPSVSLSNSVVSFCEGQSGTISATGAGNNGTYSWSPASGSGSNIVVSPTVTTLYTAYCTNSLGCTASAQIPVVVLVNPVLSVSAANTLVCNGQSVTLSASGASTYTWSSGANSATAIVTPAAVLNNYTVTGTSATNTCSATETIAIAVLTPSVNFTSSLSVCSGANATLNASGASTYTWNNVPLGTSGQIVMTPSASTNYTLITNTSSLNLNCLSTHIATVTVNPNPTVNIVSAITASICKGETNTLTASGANSYTWAGLGSSSLQVVVSPSVNTTYTLFGQTINGCNGSSQILVKVSNCTGIDEAVKSSVLTIYPNPARDYFNIYSDLEMQIEIYDANGRLLKTIQLSTGHNNINTTELTKGLYYLKGTDGSSTWNQKVVLE